HVRALLGRDAGHRSGHAYHRVTRGRPGSLPGQHARWGLPACGQAPSASAGVPGVVPRASTWGSRGRLCRPGLAGRWVMPGKAFASSADLAAKEQTLETLADGVYALTAEGDQRVDPIGEGLQGLLLRGW